MPIKFGTDGWRAVIGQDYTFHNVRLCAQGASLLLKEQGRDSQGLIVGYDTRFASEDSAAVVAGVSAGNGIKTFLSEKAVPTPVLSYNLVSRGAGGGVVITASHNPAKWNGFKYKPEYGGSASPEITAELERYIAKAEAKDDIKEMPLALAKQKGLLELIDPEPAYLEHISTLVDLEAIRSSGLRIVVDSMYGAGANFFRKCLEGGASVVKEYRSEKNPAFPGMLQPEPLPRNLESLISSVEEESADIGLATDGDADRLGIIDERGQFITTLQAFALLCFHQLEVLCKRGPLVRSITMTSMIDCLGEIYGVPVYTTKVGFKHLGPIMIREDGLAAGEESGGYAFRGSIPERDGILSGLMILEMMTKTGKSVSELLDLLSSKVGPHYYDRWDISFDESKRASILERFRSSNLPVLSGKRVRELDTREGFRFLFDGGYWALVRFSGTEPLVRIYAEAESPEIVVSLLEELREIAGI